MLGIKTSNRGQNSLVWPEPNETSAKRSLSLSLRDLPADEFTIELAAGQTEGFRPLLDVFIPSIYRIFRATQNANRWRIINQMFAKSLPLDARVKKYR